MIGHFENILHCPAAATNELANNYFYWHCCKNHRQMKFVKVLLMHKNIRPKAASIFFLNFRSPTTQLFCSIIGDFPTIASSATNVVMYF